MGRAERFDRRLENLVGNTFARMFGGNVVTQEVAIALERESEENVRELAGGRQLAPNHYIVSLGSADHERMAGDEQMVNALKGADADGMPLKAIVTQGGIKTTVELVKADKKSLPASMFEIPAGYTKTTGNIPAMDELKSDPRADDAKKRMEEMLKRMPPEQREKFEQMMKQRQGANPSQP